MDEKPGIVKFTPHSTSRSAMLIAVAVTVGVQVALCAVLVAIHLQDMWFPSVQGGDVEMTFVSPSEEVSLETEPCPEELAVMRISMNEVKRRQPVKRPAVSLPGRPEPDQNISPDKKVRYKHAPSLPNSVNSSKVGKVNAVVKVVVGVNSHGEPSSVNLLQSTGNAELDRLFMRWVRENWTFYPAEKDGVPIASKVVVPVRLNID